MTTCFELFNRSSSGLLT